jgi:hypothetical protein
MCGGMLNIHGFHYQQQLLATMMIQKANDDKSVNNAADNADNKLDDDEEELEENLESNNESRSAVYFSTDSSINEAVDALPSNHNKKKEEEDNESSESDNESVPPLSK